MMHHVFAKITENDGEGGLSLYAWRIVAFDFLPNVIVSYKKKKNVEKQCSALLISCLIFF